MSKRYTALFYVKFLNVNLREIFGNAVYLDNAITLMFIRR